MKNIIGNDIEVALPSEHTFYGMLENFIRNSAKHNKNNLNGKDLIISIYINEKNASGQIDPDFYTVTLFDNITCVNAETLLNIARNTRASIIDETGEPIRKSLGIADMRIDAHLLCSQEEPTEESLRESLEIVLINQPFEDNSNISDRFISMIISMNEVLDADEKDQLNKLQKLIKQVKCKNTVNRKGYRFGYRFKLSKTKKVCWIGKKNGDIEKLRNKGIHLFKGFEDFKTQSGKSLAAYQFAIIEPEVLKKWNIAEQGEKALENELNKLLMHLPFRVLINDKNNSLKGILKNFIDNRRIQAVEEKIKCETNSNDFDFKILEACWQEWLKRWLKTNGKQKKPHLFIYFEEKNDRWNDIGENNYFNFTQLSGSKEEIEINDDEICILFDQHGQGLGKIKNKNGNSLNWKDHFYQILGKNSADFAPIFYPPENPNSKKLFCYELIEAGLCRILVFDERLCANMFDGNEKNVKITTVENYLVYKNNLTPTLQWHLAATGKLFLGEKFLGNIIVSGSKNDDFICEIIINKESKSLKLTIKYKEFEVIDKPDCIIIHRTFLNSINERDQEDFMKKLNEIAPFIIVISGGGAVFGLKGFYKFKPLSTYNRLFTHQFAKYQIVKSSLT